MSALTADLANMSSWVQSNLQKICIGLGANLVVVGGIIAALLFLFRRTRYDVWLIIAVLLSVALPGVMMIILAILYIPGSN